MVHFMGKKSETRWCTLIMVADQKLLDLAGSLLQNDFQDPRKYWGDAQDIEKEE